MKLLLVDDNEILIQQMFKYLTNREHEVATAMSGEKALELMEQDTFDVCLTDLKMPGMNGDELLKIIQERFPSTRVIIKTAYGSIRGALNAIKRGAFDFVHKPFQMEELNELLDRIDNRSD